MSSVASDWGGLVINGLASQTACNLSDVGTANCTADGEGGSGSYGGIDDADNSGENGPKTHGGFEKKPKARDHRA